MKKLCQIVFIFVVGVSVSFDVLAENDSVTNVTEILRQSIRQLQKIGRVGPITPESAPQSYYSSPAEGPRFEARCMEVNGRFRYRCSYQMNPAPECSWSERVRKIGTMRIFADFNREPVWQLLARSPATYSFEEVLKTLGKPYRSFMLKCMRCGQKDLRWEYAIVGKDDNHDAILHTLTFSFAADGRCKGWVWLSQ